MGRKIFKGLYLQSTESLLHFSFVTYTPQTQEQMIRCGDLRVGEEYFNQVICDFLLFISEGVLKTQFTSQFLIQYDDVAVICSRPRGRGIQHEYLIHVRNKARCPKGLELLRSLNELLSAPAWNGSVGGESLRG
ncbi:hypothetical protein OAE26_01025 [Synechococcus sp. AH-551-E05]|nr:hypothetical protein [Synechococcus sp. AH-551-E05]MDB4651147.1 hypothetical protein [Synechococcus sp. AH-551-E05]